MIKELPRYILLFVLLITLQVLVFNNINLSGYINPYIYVLFILLLPFSIPNWVLLIIGFFTGFTVDYFMNTLGLHTSASLILAFVRPTILSGMSYRDDLNRFDSPGIGSSGLEWFLRYAVIAVLIHHTSLFILETFSFYYFHITLIRILLSSLFTTLFIVLFELLRSGRK